MSRIAILTVLLVCVGTPVVSQTDRAVASGYADGTVKDAAQLLADAARSRTLQGLDAQQSLTIVGWTQADGEVTRMAVGGVTYTLTGNLPPREATSSAPVLPVAVVNAVRNDGHLASLRIGTGPRIGTLSTATTYTINQQYSAQPQFSATFNFADLSEFDDWYASRPAQDLHRAVENAAVPGTVQVNLNMNRPRTTEQTLSSPSVQPGATQTTGR